MLGIWGLRDIFVLHYYILQTVILGKFSCVVFFILVYGAAFAQAAVKAVPQGLGTGLSQLILLLTLACHVAPFD